MKKIIELAESIEFKTNNVHEVYHKFCDYMMKWYHSLEFGWKKDFTISKRKYKVFDITKVKGYDAMKRVENFYNKYPDNIHITGCDDDSFCSSNIVLIEHLDKENKYFMGTTVLFIPQSVNVQNSFFLYPHHLDDLIKILKKIQENQRKYK